MPHPRHGELLPNGFHVGDLVTYDTADEGKVGFVVPVGNPDMVYATYRQVEEGGEAEARRLYERGASGTWMSTRRTILIRRFDEGSNTMSITFNGEELSADMQPEEGVVEGREYRVIYPRDYHDFEFIGRAMATTATARSVEFEVVRWVRENSGYSNERYPVGARFNSTPAHRTSEDPTCLHLPLSPEVTEAPTDTVYDGTTGSFEPHNGQIPESGTVVRAMHNGNANRQIEGLFLRMNSAVPEFAWVDAKRRRTKRTDGTFSEWESYSARAERSVVVEGAEVFKPGATSPAPATPSLTRTSVINDTHSNASVGVGMILSARAYNDSDRIYRGRVVEKSDNDGYFYVEATHFHRIRSADRYSDNGTYNWEAMPAERKRVIADWSEGREMWNRAGWVWEELAPGQKPIEPAFDPKRATPYTGRKIGDLVVGLRHNGGRDTVSSWVRGTIVRWDTRTWNPIIKVTDPMESDRKVDQEVTLYKEDTYPALADPKNADPEEFKKTLRAYLIGRHKRSDMCRGGLNTMLAAFGLPLYETRRRAVMQITVDYDPNTTDLYAVQSGLQRGLPGVQGLSFAERTGEDIELAVESDRTQG